MNATIMKGERSKLLAVAILAMFMVVAGSVVAFGDNTDAAGDANADTAVASIGDQYYSTLDLAIKDANNGTPENPVEIKLLKDTDLASEDGSDYTIQNVTITADADAGITLTLNNALRIEGTVGFENVKIAADGPTLSLMYIGYNGNISLSLTNVSFDTSVTTEGGPLTIYTDKGSKVTISDSDFANTKLVYGGAEGANPDVTIDNTKNVDMNITSQSAVTLGTDLKIEGESTIGDVLLAGGVQFTVPADQTFTAKSIGIYEDENGASTGYIVTENPDDIDATITAPINEPSTGTVTVSTAQGFMNVYNGIGVSGNIYENVEEIALAPGTYDIDFNKTLTAEDTDNESLWQAGWYFPITKTVSITGSGEGKTILKANRVTENGPLASQTYILVAADNVNIQDLTILGKSECNKNVYVTGDNLTMKNVTLNDSEATRGGSILFEFDVTGATLEDVTIYNSWISGAYVTGEGLNLKMTDVSIDNTNLDSAYTSGGYLPINVPQDKVTVAASNVDITLNDWTVTTDFYLPEGVSVTAQNLTITAEGSLVDDGELTVNGEYINDSITYSEEEGVTVGYVSSATAFINALSEENVDKIALNKDITITDADIGSDIRLVVAKDMDLGGNTLTVGCGDWKNGNLAVDGTTAITITNGTIDAPDAIRSIGGDITYSNVTFPSCMVMTNIASVVTFNGCTFGTAGETTSAGVYYSNAVCNLTIDTDCRFIGTYDQGAVAIEASAPVADIDAYIPSLNIWISADEDTTGLDVSGGIGETWVSGISASSSYTELTTEISIPGQRVMLYDCRNGAGGLTIGSDARMLTPEATTIIQTEGFSFTNNNEDDGLSENVVVVNRDAVEATVEIENLPSIFMTDEEIVFSVTTSAGDYGGIMVAGIISGGSDSYTLYYLTDGNKWDVMSDWFGPATGFPLIDGTSYFKVVFDEPDQLDITVDIVPVNGSGEIVGDAICSDSQKLLVQKNPAYKEPRQKDDYLAGFSIDGNTIDAYILASEETSDYLSYYNPYHEVYYVIDMYQSDGSKVQMKIEDTEMRMTTTDAYGMLGNNLILADYDFEIPEGAIMVSITGYINWDGMKYIPTGNTEWIYLPTGVSIVDSDGNDFESGIVYTDETLDLDAVIVPVGSASTDVTWTYSDETIATIDVDGIVTPVAAGVVTITVETVNGMKDTCTITVREPLAVTGITVEDSVSGYYGYPIDENEFTDITITVTYNDNSEETVPLTSDMVSGDIFNEGRLCEEGKVKADVTYEGFIAEDVLNVTVGKLQTVSAITPTTIVYHVGDTVTADNLKEKGVSIRGSYSYELQNRDILDLDPNFDPLTITGGVDTVELKITYTEPESNVVFTVGVTITVEDSTEEPIEP